MTKVGILNCSNMTQDIGCSAFGCLDCVNKGTGAFDRYAGGAELVGIINCAGCPTSRAPEKLLNRLRTLTEVGGSTMLVFRCRVDARTTGGEPGLIRLAALATLCYLMPAWYSWRLLTPGWRSLIAAMPLAVARAAAMVVM